MLALTGALEVLVFDHNVRSAVRAARGEPGVRDPVDQVHNDYTLDSGPRRTQQILEAAGRPDLAAHRVAFVNLWRPIISGPCSTTRSRSAMRAAWRRAISCPRPSSISARMT
jgi:hypothetical protein